MTLRDSAAQHLDPDRIWEAFLTHDRSLDGAVWCGVRSTGIYCRPTCPARRPARSQVRFYFSADEAREDGYRACLRCHPDRPETDADLVGEACRFIEDFAENNENLPSAAQVSESVGLTTSRLQRLFRLETGLTVSQFSRGKRLERFKAMVREGASVSDATYDAGFGSPSRLYEGASGKLGMTPATYRKAGAGAEILYVIVESALGGLLVAGTAVGVCAVKLGDDTDSLVAELHQEFSAARLLQVAHDDDNSGSLGLGEWVTSLLNYLDGGEADIELPLDVLATAFQWRVWRRLQAIPSGETRTYQEMAGDLGQPTASRAVGRACATNPVAPIVPCHRAVRKDGGLAGYRWGLHRKEALLDMEKRQAGR